MSDSPRQAPQSHAEIIGLWPSLGEFAADIGVSYGTAKQMRRRNSIADDHRPAVVAKAEIRGLTGITFELLSRTAPVRRAKIDQGAAA